MATTDITIAYEDGWTLVATNPDYLYIVPDDPHPYAVITTASGTPSFSATGLEIDGDDVDDCEFVANRGLSGLVYIRLLRPYGSYPSNRLHFGIITGATGGAGTDTSPITVKQKPPSTQTDRSGTIATGGTAQPLAPALNGRYFTFQNISDTVMYISESGVNATAGPGSYLIPANGGSFSTISQNALSVFCSTSAKGYTATDFT